MICICRVREVVQRSQTGIRPHEVLDPRSGTFFQPLPGRLLSRKMLAVQIMARSESMVHRREVY